MEKAKTERNYGIDFLRIIAMIMIVLLHVINQGGVLNATGENIINRALAEFFVAAAYGAVNCYALVSGYVGMNSKHKYSSLIQLYFQVIFYTVITTSVFYFLKPEMIGVKNFLDAFLPVSNESYWYFTAYFGMFFFAPFLNRMLLSLSKREARTLAFTIVIILSVIPCVFQKDVFKSEWGYSMIWLLALYLLGGCIKITESEKKLKKGVLLLIFLICVIITFLSTLLRGINKYTFLLTYTSPTVLIGSVSVLVLFSQFNICGLLKKLISFFAPLSFGVYLAHNEPHIFNEVLRGRFSSFGAFSPDKFVIAVFATVLAIWLVCSMIDYVRLKLFKFLRIKELSIRLESFFAKLFC